jgi:hypothetical protein
MLTTAGALDGSPPLPPAAAAAALPRTVLLSKKATKRSTSSVALLMTSRRSGRRRCTFLRRPSSVSVAKLRSCASSTMMTLRAKQHAACIQKQSEQHIFAWSTMMTLQADSRSA